MTNWYIKIISKRRKCLSHTNVCIVESAQTFSIRYWMLSSLLSIRKKVCRGFNDPTYLLNISEYVKR